MSLMAKLTKLLGLAQDTTWQLRKEECRRQPLSYSLLNTLLTISPCHHFLKTLYLLTCSTSLD